MFWRFGGRPEREMEFKEEALTCLQGPMGWGESPVAVPSNIVPKASS